MLVLIAGLVAAGLAPSGAMAPALAASGEIAIRANGVEPSVLQAVTGERVTFANRVQTPVHVEFGHDPALHRVFQVPVVGPVWAVFHRRGTHPYVVHIYGEKTVTLRGLVEVVEDPHRPWAPGTCGATVMGDCIEP
jgi:hypothetical protein